MPVSKHDLETVRHDLDLEESLDLHVRRWRVRAVASVAVLLLAILTVLGLFGDGPLSSTTVSANGATLHYERFVRHGKETRMEVRIGKGNVVALPLDYLARFKLDRVVPEPRSARVRDGSVVFEFDATGELRARFHLLPDDPGYLSTTVTAAGTPLTVTQFVYP